MGPMGLIARRLLSLEPPVMRVHGLTYDNTAAMRRKSCNQNNFGFTSAVAEKSWKRPPTNKHEGYFL